MSALDQILTKWKLWIYRDRTFQADELKELQSHLMEEINFLVNREGLSEEEAFHQAVSLVGDREGLDQEYVKEKSTPGKVIHWAKVNNWSITLLLFLTCVFLVSDLIYSNTHSYDVYEPLNDQYYFSSDDRNSYAEMVPIKDKKIVNITPHYQIAETDLSKPEYTVLMTVDGKPTSGIWIHPPYDIVDVVDEKDIFDNDIWDPKKESEITTNPVLIGRASIFNANYKFVLDDQNQLWLEQYSKFQINSPRIRIKTQNVIPNKIFYDTRFRKEPKNDYLFVEYPHDKEDTNFMFFTTFNPYQILLYQKEFDAIKTIRLQLIKLTNQNNPILVWDEVSLVHKPIHLWDPIIFSIERHFSGEFNVNS